VSEDDCRMAARRSCVAEVVVMVMTMTMRTDESGIGTPHRRLSQMRRT